MGFQRRRPWSYRANYSASLESIEQVSDLTSEGIDYQMNTTFTKPVNVSPPWPTTACSTRPLAQEVDRLDDPAYIETIREYQHLSEQIPLQLGLPGVRGPARYYNFNGLDRCWSPATLFENSGTSTTF